MKKNIRILLTLSLVLILSLAVAGTAFAGKGNPKGTITAIDETTQTMTLETADGSITVTLPDGFDYGSIAVEMYVVVRGEWTGEDTITAATVKETTPEDEAESEEPEGTTPGDSVEGTIAFMDTEDPPYMVLTTVDGQVLVNFSGEFDFTPYSIGDEIVLYGEWTGDLSFTATGVEPPTGGDDDDDDDDDDGNGKGNHQNVFCTDKKDTVHPMAAGIGETYGMDEGQIQAMFCEGYSVGEVMLALQTQAMNGGDMADTLAQRKGGKGWGQIWKDAGLIGNQDEALPPGQAKKLENAGEGQGQGQGQDKDKKDNPGHGGTPPGQEGKDGGDDDD
jgi:hypothetical protein